ncbi:MAG: Fe-S cluster assembly protein SufE [Micavibrio aeruginosavorus]|uniref:Fe-S cluster assembly protein SufE n=1 Tax=Micavibrio aeruginosavorus TaxID=349221 RepID=A0A2W5FMH3_9BACT|nr:MAG: Fe-S cluster assembly protein SufE [Micavibrio aeruginosavorus]
MTSALQPLDQILETFALLDDWEGRFQYILDLGKTVPEMPEVLKSPENEVKGCTSKVWMVPEIRNDVFHFQADSNAQIVKGLIGILMSIYQDSPVEEIKGIDVEGIFRELGLEQNLSPNRRSGFFSMVEKIRAFS